MNKHKNTIKKILCFLLVTVLSIGFIPVSAIEASDCSHEATKSVYDGDYLVTYCLDCETELAREFAPQEEDHKHSYDEGIIIKDADCTETGLIRYTCDVCDDYYEDTVPATGHSFEFAYNVAPTCEEGGYDMYICSECGAEEKRNEVSSITHNYIEKSIELPDGSTSKIEVCQFCNAAKQSESVSSHKHNLTFETTKQATCTEPGIITYSCADEDCDDLAGSTYTVEVPATGHNFVWVTDSVATCETDGHRYQLCSVCNAIGEEETIEATGHVFNEDGLIKIISAPDCYHEGVASLKCENCDAKKQISVPKTDHEFVLSRTVPSTCTEAGFEEYVCQNCTDKNTTPLSLASHNYENKIVVAATCTEDGYSADVCTECGDEINKVTIPATGHTNTLISTTPATCLQASSETYKCDNCSKISYTHETAATGHNYGDWEVTKPASCIATGTKTSTCSGCGAVMTETIPMIDHSLGWVVSKNATMTEEGEEILICSYCNHIEDRRTIAKVDHEHVFGKDVVVTAPTCQSVGLATRTCEICGETYNALLEKVDHSYGAPTIDYVSTCTTQGQQSAKCIWCNLKDGSSIEKLPLASHEYEDYYTIDTQPTCTQTGSKSKHCINCEATTDTQVIEKLEHDYVVTSSTPASCTSGGTQTVVCSDCGDTKTQTISKPSGHRYVTVHHAETCTQGGYDVHTCSACGDEYTDNETKAPGHVPLEAKTENVTPATCKTVGSHDVVVYCANCSAELSRDTVEDPMVSHTYVDTEIPATCKEAGHTHHKCSSCGDEYDDNYTRLAAHTEGPFEIVQASTCTTPGSEDSKCTVCGAVINTNPLPLDENAHTFVENSTNKADPTCTEAGKRIDTCSECGQTTEVELPALGHKYTSNVVKEATYDEEGKKEYTCSVCGDKYDEVIPKLTRPSQSSNNSSSSDSSSSSSSSSTPVASSTTESLPVQDETSQDKDYTLENSSNDVVSINPSKETSDIPANEEKKDEVPAISAQVEDNELLEELLNSKGEIIKSNSSDMQLTPRMLEAARDNDNTIVLTSDKYYWTIAGKNIRNPKDVSLLVYLNKSSIRSTSITKLVGDNDFMELTLAHEGDFGFDATLNIDVDAKYNDLTATLYYYNNGTFERQDSCVVENSTVHFDFTHASEYVIVFTEDDETAKLVDEVMAEREANLFGTTKFKASVILTIIIILALAGMASVGTFIKKH